ncbi:hypothetical protein LCGC14_2911760 [marine sediment metagenome]|uniref:Uncharacterized protein n=1 Tax=marine sediment metagenome TaxID=412755 RepID=A0A0F8ZZ23_9ZZZZ
MEVQMCEEYFVDDPFNPNLKLGKEYFSRHTPLFLFQEIIKIYWIVSFKTK